MVTTIDGRGALVDRVRERIDQFVLLYQRAFPALHYGIFNADDTVAKNFYTNSGKLTKCRTGRKPDAVHHNRQTTWK